MTIVGGIGGHVRLGAYRRLFPAGGQRRRFLRKGLTGFSLGRKRFEARSGKSFDLSLALHPRGVDAGLSALPHYIVFGLFSHSSLTFVPAFRYPAVPCPGE